MIIAHRMMISTCQQCGPRWRAECRCVELVATNLEVTRSRAQTVDIEYRQRIRCRHIITVDNHRSGGKRI
jgi:hypothetical protein